MASSYRLATGTLLDATPRKVVSASFGHSLVKSFEALSTEPFESSNIPGTFDIFDAPMKLRGRYTPDGLPRELGPPSIAYVAWKADSSHSKNIYNNTLGLPWSLPPPMTFDGPARPPHMSPSTLQMRRQQRQHLIHSPRGAHRSSTVSCSTFTSQSEPLSKLFDGPSRLTRCQYPTLQNERYSLTYVSLVLCLSSAFGWFALQEFVQQIDIKSL